MEDRVSLYPGRVKLIPVSGQTDVYDMVRADEPTQDGTALNKANLLTDVTAALFGLGTDAVPNDVLVKIKDLIDVNAEAIANGTKIATGSYKGTGTYGSSNPCKLTFDFAPKFLWIYGYEPSSPSVGFYHFLNNDGSTIIPTDCLTTSYSKYYGLWTVSMSNKSYVLAKKSDDGKTISWYTTLTGDGIASSQVNASGYTYYYLAIG